MRQKINNQHSQPKMITANGNKILVQGDVTEITNPRTTFVRIIEAVDNNKVVNCHVSSLLHNCYLAAQLTAMNETSVT